MLICDSFNAAHHKTDCFEVTIITKDHFNKETQQDN